MDPKPQPRQRRAVTTSEVARLCGLSRTTVSAVLNGKATVRESTRRKVLQRIRECHYESGMLSREMVGELSRTVAILAADLGNPFSMTVFRGVCAFLERNGCHALVHHVHPANIHEPEMPVFLQTCLPSGYVILKGAEGRGCVHAMEIMGRGIPLVMVGGVRGVSTHAVTFDSRAAMRMAVEHVTTLGHRRIGYLAGPPRSEGAKERKLGFVEGLVEHNLPVALSSIVDAGETAAAGYAAALDMLRVQANRHTALLCFNDMVAMGVYRAAHELGLGIPGDLSVVGFDGLEYGALLGPPLTTVDIQPELLGQRAAELLVRLMDGGKTSGVVTEWTQPKLLERASVRDISVL